MREDGPTFSRLGQDDLEVHPKASAQFLADTAFFARLAANRLAPVTCPLSDRRFSKTDAFTTILSVLNSVRL